MATPHVVCFGELLLRLSAPGRELMLQSPRMDVCVGGAEANVAVALAHFGHAVNMISTVASNELGDAARGELRRHGVDTCYVATGHGRMGLYFLQTGASQRPSQVLYDRANSAFALAAPDTYHWSSLLDGGARALHVSGVTLAVGPNAAAVAIAAVRAARERGLHVVFDSNYRSKLWQAWNSDPPRMLREIFSCADTVFADHRDLALVLGSDFSGGPPERIASSAAAAAFKAFPQLQRIVSTQRLQHSVDDHEIGASLITRTHALKATSVRVAGIVDRIGTGDAFAAGVLHGLFTGMSEQDSLDIGLAAGCLKHSIPGDFFALGVKDVNEFLAGRRFDVRR